jgi:hypothetical protein
MQLGTLSVFNTLAVSTYGAKLMKIQEELVDIERETLKIQREVLDIEKAKLLIKQQKHQVYTSSKGGAFTDPP